MDFFTKLKIGFIAISSIIAGIFNPLPALVPIEQLQPQFGTAIPVPVASFTTSLASAISSSDTSMTLVSTSTDDGTTLTNGSVYGFVIDASTADEEYVLGTASSSNIVSMTRGISVITGNTSVAALKKAHRRGSSVKITDAPVLLVMARIMNGDETFPNILKYDNPKTFTASSSIIDKNYADNLVIAKMTDGNYTTFGGFVLATTSQLINGTATSTATRYLVAPSELFNATSSAKNIVPVTKTNGKLSQGFLDLTEGYTWSATTTFTGEVIGALPIGSITQYASTTAPTGWLLADGTAYSTSTYSALYGVIGYTYGSSTGQFKVPNFKGRVGRGYNAASSSVDVMGETGGEETHTQTVAEMPTHTHSLTNGPKTLGSGANWTNGWYNVGGTSDTGSDIVAQSNGSGQAYNVLDPYITITYIIKYR